MLRSSTNDSLLCWCTLLIYILLPQVDVNYILNTYKNVLFCLNICKINVPTYMFIHYSETYLIRVLYLINEILYHCVYHN